MIIPKNQRIFVTGGSGLLGWTLTRYLPREKTLFQYFQHQLPATLQSIQLDLRQRPKLVSLLNDFQPNIIINTAALTDPIVCDREPESAHILNSETPEWLADWSAGNEARLLHISTDLVFDGRQGHYNEKDRPNPNSVYAKTKLAGEEAVLKKCGNGTVLRLSLMGGASFTGQRSLNEVIPLTLKKQGKVRLFKDEYRSPIWADNVAEVIRELLVRDCTGLLHVPGGKDYSRYEIGEIIFRHYGLPLDKLKTAWVAEFTGSPPRCPDVTLSNSLADQVLKTPRHDFASGFGRYLNSGEV